MTEAEQKALVAAWGEIGYKIHKCAHTHTTMTLSADEVKVLDTCVTMMVRYIDPAQRRSAS